MKPTHPEPQMQMIKKSISLIVDVANLTKVWYDEKAKSITILVQIQFLFSFSFFTLQETSWSSGKIRKLSFDNGICDK